MAGSTTVFFVFSVTACLFSSTAQAGRCVSCSYQNAGDGTTNLECVTEPFKEPRTQNISCDFATKACVSKAVYSPDYVQLRSFSRFCLDKVELPSEGCNTDQNPSCSRVCSTDLCNQKNITLLYQEWTNGVTSLAPPAERCVSCTYQNAGDGNTNLECVTEPFKEPRTQNISCDFATKACVSKAVYDPDYVQLRSFIRFCLDKVELPSEGCNTDQNPSCYRVCSTDLCNQKNITLLNQEWTNGVTSLAPPAERCVSCTYQNAGDGKTNLECVTEPFKEPRTQNISCDFATKACVSKAVYDPDYAQLRSFGRFCLDKVGLPSEGCNTDQNPSCNRVCSTDLCNQKNITLLNQEWALLNQEWTNGVPSLAHSLLLTLWLCAVSYLVV